MDGPQKSFETGEGVKEFELAGAYSKETSSIYICTTNFKETVLHPRSREALEELIYDSSGTYGSLSDFFDIFIMAEEACHFVQHTRGELPHATMFPVQYSAGEVPFIANRVIPLEEEARYRKAMRDTFDYMGYTGKQPKGIYLTDEPIRVKTANRGTIQYLQEAQTGKSYETRKYETDAQTVKVAVANRWFQEMYGITPLGKK